MLGKTPQSLVWSENILRYHHKSKSKIKPRVLIAAPLAVSRQFVREGEKFGIKVNHTQEGKLFDGINITNYERLDRYNPSDFQGMVCDESSALKSLDSKRRKEITEFMSSLPYRLLCSATPSPNDFMELGTSSQALGNMKHNQMLAMFFTHDEDSTQQWRLKGHAKKRFWQWVATWARAVRKPSDLGFSDEGFILPKLNILKHVLPSEVPSGKLFPRLAKTLDEQRAERIKTLVPRCEKIVELLPKKEQAIIWVQLNPEGDLLEKMIPDAVQVAGKDKDKDKEDRLIGFAEGKHRVLITKSKIGGWGLNLQNCHEVFYFPSWSAESWYQSIRRCWRFGQKSEVNAHLVTSQAEKLVLDGMMRKERQSVELFEGVVREMNTVLKEEKDNQAIHEIILPSWL